MARVDHKKIRQLIAQKQKAFAAYFADMALAQTRRYGYHRRVKVRTVWEPKNGNTAMTNNELIWLNAGHPSITQHKSRAERYAQLCGLFAHELGHVLYTDFITSQTHLTRLDSGFWYPEPPPLRTSREQHAEEELWDYSGDSRKHQSMVRFIMHDIMNILEDGYIEQRMIAEYPGVLGQNLQARRASTFADMPTLSQVIENEPEQGHVWLTIQQALLSYMKWGELKYGDTPLTDERVQVVFGLLPELDKALLSRDLRDRCRAANLIMVRCWHYIKDFLDHCEEMAEQATPGGDDCRCRHPAAAGIGFGRCLRCCGGQFCSRYRCTRQSSAAHIRIYCRQSRQNSNAGCTGRRGVGRGDRKHGWLRCRG